MRLIQRDAAGIGRTYLRAASPQAVDRLAAARRGRACTAAWSPTRTTSARCTLFADPDGHELGVYWDVEWYRADDTRPARR